MKPIALWALLYSCAACGRLGFAGDMNDAGSDAAADSQMDASVVDPDSSADASADAPVDASADGGRDASVGASIPQRVYVETFSTGATSFVPIPSANIVIPPSALARDWLVIGSGRLRWAGGAAATPQVEARMTVGGVQRGLGGSAGLDGSSGPFQFFDVVAAGAAPIDVRIELRSPAAPGTADQVRLIAVPLRESSLTYCTSTLPVPELTPEGPVASLDVPAGANFVFAQLSVQDTLGGDVSIRLTKPGGGDWPEARALQHGRLNYQSFMVSRFFTNPGPVTMTAQVSAATEARMGHARICAIPSTTLAQGASFFATDPSLVSTRSTTLEERQRLNLTTPGGGRVLIWQNVAAYTPGSELLTTRAVFEQDGTTLHAVDFRIDQMGMSPTYGYADLVDTVPDSSFGVFLAEPETGAEIVSYEATSYAVEL